MLIYTKLINFKCGNFYDGHVKYFLLFKKQVNELSDFSRLEIYCKNKDKIKSNFYLTRELKNFMVYRKITVFHDIQQIKSNFQIVRKFKE